MSVVNDRGAPHGGVVAAICTVALFAASCTAPDDAEAPRVVREIDPDGAEIVASSRPKSAAAAGWRVDSEPELAIGTEAGEPESLLSNVGGAVRLDDGRIIVADGDFLALRVYDAEGTYLEAWGGRGGGPGEFEYLFGVMECNQEVWAMVLPRAYSRFDLTGGFIDLLRLTLPEGGTPYAHTCNASGQHLTIGWGPGGVRTGMHRTRTRASIHALGGELLADLGEVFGSERWGYEGGSMPHPYGRQTVLGLGRDRAFVGLGEAHELLEYDFGGRQVRRVRWAGRPLVIDAAEIRRYRDWIEAEGEYDPGLQRDAEIARTMEFPETMPAYTALQIDDSEHIWVRGFSPPGIAREDWEVFAPDGEWLATVAAPFGLRVTEIGEDFLLGIYEDEAGTEFVRLHELVREAPPGEH